ncbi:MAG: acetyl-CoA carboxylase biotin carboxylase subunit [Nitrososphaerales archaeon]|nr:acetyl-CoA carboxylase biotin carboxylase subunit [Nitrososphaerales archaeon]
MFNKVLIANRGEIAVRVIRACRLMGVSTVAIYSDADRDALHVKLADEAYRVGSPPPSDSYLNIASIISIAKRSGAEGVHPGYGFLAENSTFSGACEKEGIKFIGPTEKTLLTTGNKTESKRLAKAQGVPVTPGTERIIEDVDEAKGIADSIGYPILLKSAYGGGGRGIREVRSEDELKQGFTRATNEAKGAFGRAGMYIEKLIAPARHIEIQILADGKGNAIHLGERECSIQRRHQKLVELTPSPAVTEEIRKRVGGYAVKVAKAVGYENAGTIEFLMDKDGNFYFMEVNSRLQVEHPVTEAVTGVDLVRQQLIIASTGCLPLAQNDIVRSGAAIECRINAEDPASGFAPSAGTIGHVHLPGGPGVRVDTALYDGYVIPEFYDSLIAKIIVRGEDLEDARRRMVAALSEFSITGIRTTIPFHTTLLQSEPFMKWDLGTDFIERTGIVEQMAKRAEIERQQLEDQGLVIAAAMLAKGIHKVVELETETKGVSRWALPPTNREARFFDEV